MFDNTKEMARTFVNDRVTAPVRTSLILAGAAFIMALAALCITAVRSAHL